jgi:hypothetical protein
MDFLNSLPVADVVESSILLALLIDRALAWINPKLATVEQVAPVSAEVLKALVDMRLERDELKKIAKAIDAKFETETESE